MGTDSIKLFNRVRAEEILAMERLPLIQFLEANIEVLQQKASLGNPVLSEIEQSHTSVSDAVERLVSEGYPFVRLREDVARDFAFGEQEIYLDYWGCYAAVFDGHPDGSISSLQHFPHAEEETFLLLRSEHLQLLIKSIYEHLDDLRVMDKEQIENVERWQAFCSDNQGFMIAYMFDY